MYGRSESEHTLIGGDTGRESQMYADDGVPVEEGPPSSRLRAEISATAMVFPRSSLDPDAAADREGVGVALLD